MLPPSRGSYARRNIQFALPASPVPGWTLEPWTLEPTVWCYRAVPNKNSRRTPGLNTTNPPPSRALLHA